VVIIFTLGNSSDSFIILLGQNRGLTVLQIIGMLMTFNAVYAILAGPLGSLSDRIGRQKLMLAGWTIYGLVYLGFALSKTGIQIWLLYAFYGIYYALTEGVAKALVADIIPQEQRGTAYGYFNAAIGIAALPASLIAGVLWQFISPSAPFVFGAALSLFASFLLITWGK
jgi:MFS family permease